MFGNEDFWEAVQHESDIRHNAMLDGIASYRETYRTPERHPSEIIWRKGNARLHDYGSTDLPADAPTLLCIPSLINKATIFDLMDGYSLVEYMLAHGIRPLVLDWGEPGYRERHFDAADYVQKYARDALKYTRRHYAGQLYLLGYCMGGVFTSALAQLEKEKLDGLILLATPWDFQSKDSLYIPLNTEQRAQLRGAINAQDTLPKEWLEWMFHFMQPFRFQEKFAQFTQMNEEEKSHFIAVEDWVSDGIPLSTKVAEECLLLWPQDNLLQKEAWQVNGEIIRPSEITLPTLAIIPSDDTIVPSGCALALAEQIEHAHIIQPPCGHVSMVAGKRAEQLCWKPLVSWIRAN